MLTKLPTMNVWTDLAEVSDVTVGVLDHAPDTERYQISFIAGSGERCLDPRDANDTESILVVLLGASPSGFTP